MAAHQLILDRYRLIGESHSGGFGTVRIAWDTRIQRKVAIKCIELDEVDAARATLPGADAVRKRSPLADGHDVLAEQDVSTLNCFEPDEDDDQLTVRSLSHIPGLDEARTAAMLTDPNIVTVYDFEIQGQTAYLIMEYIEGITLTELLRTYESYLTLDMVAAVFTSVAHALEVAHENQVLHLDIKPDNILINRQGQVKVTDFGLATLADAGGFGVAGGGTIGYMPLEQMRGVSLDARSDEWALAAVTYEMLVGKNPFLAPNLARAESAIENAELVLSSLCWDELDQGIDDVVFYALDPDRDERYDTVADFAEEMEKFLGSPKIGHRELAVIVGDAQGDDCEEEEGTEPRGSRNPHFSLRNMLTRRTGAVAARLMGAVGSGVVALVALVNLLQVSSLESIFSLAGSSALLFWGPLGLIALAGVLKPHLGALLAYCALSIALVAQGAPAVGVVFLVATAAWWYFVGRWGNASANATFVVSLAGAVGGNQLAPAAAGFFLPSARALGTTAFALFVAALLTSFSLGNLLGWDVSSFWELSGADVQANLGSLLLQPATWCVAASWLASSGLLSVCRCRRSRLLAVLGVVLASTVLVAGICGAAWFASGQRTWVPSAEAIVPIVVAVIGLVVATCLESFVLETGEALEEAESSEG